MQSLKQLCEPRESVFDKQRRDTVLDLTDLREGRIDPDKFFEENFVTEGMRTLLEQAFLRLEGKSSQGIFKLKQAMGGGKTHNLLTLGLLAQNPKYREQVMGKFYKPDKNLGEVKVVAFTGRESDVPYGIWGAIAEQMGKKDLFKDLYSPPSAPGQTAWEELFDGETVLVLLDELPPYLVNARARQIGDSNLAQVTATAIANLLNAIGRGRCENVCLVITDLSGSYVAGSQQISEILSDLEKETHRSVMPIEPVRMNSDELYHILRKRLFEKLPSEQAISDVAQGYAQAIRDAKQMDITNESPEQFASRIQVSYPFHPAIRDLYARFKENEGFQQTRGLIRLMRIVVSRMWESDEAKERYLIAAHHLDFNDRDTRTEISQINGTLENAVAHDIASEGSAVAEMMDKNLGGTDTQDATRLIFMSSLANVPNAVLGLSIPEIIAYLAEPGRDLAKLQTQVLEQLSTAAWYLHGNRDGKLFFKNTENLNAKLESLVKAFLPEQAKKELRTHLKELFKPENGWCYQNVMALPAVDEIELEQDRITLVITEPHPGTDIRPELRAFWDDATWKNRVAFLTGSKSTYETLIDVGKRLRAIQQILDEQISEGVPDSDPQRKDALDLSDRIKQNFHSAVRETFTTIWYPFNNNLISADFTMKFEGNRYHGEEQILALLKEKMKFDENAAGDVFRKKAEVRLFSNTQSLPWSEIRRRAATNTTWTWHHPKALDDLKTDSTMRDVWREDGGYVDIGPFPQDKTDVNVRLVHRDDDTGEAVLQVVAVHGDTLHYDIGAPATPASAKLEEAQFKTKELRVSFLAVDSTKQHEMGDPVEWRNTITIKHRKFDGGTDKKLELQAAPRASIRYSTDGSNPKVAGAIYEGEFIVPYGTAFVLVYAEADGIESEIERVPFQWDSGPGFEVDRDKPATWSPRNLGFNSTKETYELFDRAKKFRASLVGVRLIIAGESGDPGWLEFTMYEQQEVTPEYLEELLGIMRKAQSSGQVQIMVNSVKFKLGQDMLDWIEEIKGQVNPDEIQQ